MTSATNTVLHFPEHSIRGWVPVAAPTATAEAVRSAMVGQRYESAAHIVVCEGAHLVGLVRWRISSTPTGPRSSAT